MRRGPHQLREQQDWEGWRPSREQLMNADIEQLRRWSEVAGKVSISLERSFASERSKQWREW
eukprot:9148139-Pyramimonas_sp.AAC.1